MTDPKHDLLIPWCDDLERRFLADVSFSEVRRALQALSTIYVGRRSRLAEGAALGGKGKRAAFALFYGPIHFLVIQHLVRQLGLASPTPSRVVDLGCGTGAAGAAWALESGGSAEVRGVELHPWAVEEARKTLRSMGLRGRVKRDDVCRYEPVRRDDAIIAAYLLNEIGETAREKTLGRLVAAGSAGSRVLVVEPIARRPVPWWDRWSRVFREAGGRDDEWRFQADLPEITARLDRAARLDHSRLSARSLCLGSPAGRA